MSSQDTITYLLYVDDDAIPLASSMTLGNHLDNEVMVPGEDVADFHLRVEVTPRGPVFIPLGQATFNINGVETDQPLRAMIGDVLGVGQTTIQVGFEVEQRDGEKTWFLVATDGAEVQLISELSIGRAEGADITIADAHISRFHARILERNGCVWIQDLNSANGTRVNDERIQGGVRLFHGDQVAFDRFEYQIVARGADITPVQKFEEPEKGTSESIPHTPKPAVRRDSAQAHQLSGPYLQSEAGVFPLAVGENIVGTDPEASICMPVPSLDAQHARIVVSTDGVRLTNLSTRGATQVNGIAVDSILLRDGDRLQLADHALSFIVPGRTAPAAKSWGLPGLTRLQTRWGLIIGLGILAAAVLLWLLLP